MIEKIVLDYLNSNLTEPVYMETPEKIPNTYVLIEKTGGGVTDYIYTATLAIQSIAGSLYGAALLNEKVKELMTNIIYAEDISRASLNSDYNFTDTTTKQYRYQAVYNLTY